MNIRPVTFIFFLTVILISCGIPQRDYDKLVTENERLKNELDECKFGADRLIASIEKEYSEKKYSLAKKHIKQLYDKHPESPKNKEFKQLLETIEKEELAEQKRKAAEEKERIRLANLSNTGMWSVRYFVDEFGGQTKQGYITNTTSIKGTFSNTATQDSKLNVYFIISSPSKIFFQLYEYAGNNPVKSYSRSEYLVTIQDRDGKKYHMGAVNYSDRLSINKPNVLQNILLKGGKINFYIVEADNYTTEYRFSIINADYYNNAYRKLLES